MWKTSSGADSPDEAAMEYRQNTSHSKIIAGEGNSEWDEDKHPRDPETGQFIPVVELDESSELARRVGGVTGKARAKVIANYIIETLGGRTITLHDGIYADVDNGDLTKMARDAFSHGKGLRRTAELGEITKLIDNARYSRSDDDAKHNKFSAFRYYSVKTRYKGEEESLLLNIGKNKFTGKYNFYTITVDDDE